jgi:hypothetical protein
VRIKRLSIPEPVEPVIQHGIRDQLIVRVRLIAVYIAEAVNLGDKICPLLASLLLCKFNQLLLLSHHVFMDGVLAVLAKFGVHAGLKGLKVPIQQILQALLVLLLLHTLVCYDASVGCLEFGTF